MGTLTMKLLLVCILLAYHAPSPSRSQSPNDVVREIQLLKARVTSLEGKMDKQEKKDDKLEAKVDHVEAEIKDLKTQIKGIEEQMKYTGAREFKYEKTGKSW